MSSQYDWLYRPDGRVFNNLTIPDTEQGRLELADICGKSLVETAVRSGGKIAVFDGKSQFYAFHETTISEKHPGLGSRDLVAEIITAAKANDITYVPYIPIDADQRAFREHPEWRPLKADGTPLEDPVGWPRLCENSPFGEYLADYIRELAANYEIGGLWIDGVGLNSAPDYCYCPSCRDGFRERTGLEAPTELEKDRDVWLKWMDYRCYVAKSIIARIRVAAHTVKPGLPIIAGAGWHNWQNNNEGHFSECDLIWHEPTWSWPACSIQYLRSASGKPPEHYAPTFQYAPFYPVSLPEQELRDTAMNAIAHGGLPIFTLQGCAETLSPINAELTARAPWIIDSENIPHCGIVFSQRSMHSCDPSHFSEPSHFASYGVLHALLQEKIAEQYLADKHLDEGMLDDFAAVVLPNIGYIPEKAAENLRRYVHNGGGLVALAGTSLYDKYGDLRDDFALADLFGVHYRGELAQTTQLPDWWGDLRTGNSYPNQQSMKFLALGDHRIVDDPLIRQTPAIEVVPEFQRGKRADYPLPYFGEMLKVQPHSGTNMALWEGLQEPNHHWPLITTHNYGKGRVVYISGNLGVQYTSRCTHPYIRRLISNSVRFATGAQEPPFEVEAPLHVQATIFRQPQNRVVLHLLNVLHTPGLPPFTQEEWDGYYRSFSRSNEENIPIHNIKVRLKGRFSRVYTAPDSQPLICRFENGYTHICLPRMETHLMIVGDKEETS